MHTVIHTFHRLFHRLRGVKPLVEICLLHRIIVFSELFVNVFDVFSVLHKMFIHFSYSSSIFRKKVPLQISQRNFCL